MSADIPLLQRKRRSKSNYQSRLNRERSPLKMAAIPIISVLFASMITTLPIITPQPILPPLGLMVLLAWRMLRPGIWPMWVGLPFGLFDDVFNGQPFGSSALLWSLVMIAMEEIADRLAMFRNYWQDWLIASIIIITVLLVGLWFVGLAATAPGASILLPQIIISVLLFPLIVRLCAKLDSWRLAT
jgi:rod shape-determining protein MreD